MTEKIKARKKIITYLVITFALSSIFYYLIISAGTMKVQGGLYVFALMWCPGIAGLATRLIYQRNLRGIGWGWGKTRYQLLSYVIPIFAGLAVYGIVWMTGLGGFSSENFIGKFAKAAGSQSLSLWSALIIAGTFGFLHSAIPALGEEIGWRGLLVPELAKITSFTKTAVISAIIWVVYHSPLLFFAGYNSGTPIWYGFLFFTVTIFGVSFIFAWLRLKSGSLWTAVILHASHNLFIQDVFDKLTTNTGITKYITTEFGIGLAIVYSLFAYLCWKKRGDSPDPQLNPNNHDNKMDYQIK